MANGSDTSLPLSPTVLEPGYMDPIRLLAVFDSYTVNLDECILIQIHSAQSPTRLLAFESYAAISLWSQCTSIHPPIHTHP